MSEPTNSVGTRQRPRLASAGLAVSGCGALASQRQHRKSGAETLEGWRAWTAWT